MPGSRFRDGFRRGCVTEDQAVGGAWVLQRVWEGLTPCPWVLVLLGAQMVAVNSSSPTAMCSGPWDARGLEESVTTSDGNAESLYVQGTGQPARHGPLLGWRWGKNGPGWAQVPFPGAGLQPHSQPQSRHLVVCSHLWIGDSLQEHTWSEWRL